MARDLVELAHNLNRRVGVFIDRRGRVTRVILGTTRPGVAQGDAPLAQEQDRPDRYTIELKEGFQHLVDHPGAPRHIEDGPLAPIIGIGVATGDVRHRVMAATLLNEPRRDRVVTAKFVVAGIVGASAAHFALTHLAGMTRAASLHLFDAANWQWRSIRIQKTAGCKDCGQA